MSARRDAEQELVSETISITAARQRLSQLPAEIEKNALSTLRVTRRGEPVLAIMPWGLYESIAETLEILGDEDLMAALRASVQAIAENDTYSPEEIEAELKL